jgi:hypothetical protein
MMREARPTRDTEHLPQAELTSSGRQEILAANDVRHLLRCVVHRHRKLIGPVAVAIAQQQIAALPRRLLFDPTKKQIVERFDASVDADAESTACPCVQSTLATEAVVALSLNVLPRTIARVDVMRDA